MEGLTLGVRRGAVFGIVDAAKAKGEGNKEKDKEDSKARNARLSSHVFHGDLAFKYAILLSNDITVSERKMVSQRMQVF